MNKFIFLLALVFVQSAFSQTNLKVLNPTLGEVPDLSDSTQKLYKKVAELSSGIDKMTESEKEKYFALSAKTDETKSSPFDVLGGGCNWYCGEGPYKQIASSTLKPSASIKYVAENAHDFSYETAWVEGVPGDGVGEYLEYYFTNKCPRVTTIFVSNGYVKTNKAWKENARVKTLKLFVNNKPYALLNLKDTKADQVFTIGEPLGRFKDGKEMILKFQIVDVYKGDKYKDTAITEIYFSGIDVH